MKNISLAVFFMTLSLTTFGKELNSPSEVESSFETEMREIINNFPFYVVHGDLEKVSLTLKYLRVDVNEVVTVGDSYWEVGTPLYHAILGGHSEIVRLILAYPGIDVNKYCDGDQKTTALYWASFLGYEDIVRTLLSHPGIDVNKAREDRLTPLNIASLHDHNKIVKLLKEAGAKE